MHRDGIDVFTSFQQAFIFYDAVCLWCPCVRPAVRSQPLAPITPHVCVQSATLNAKLVTRVVLVGMRLRGKVIRSQREQVVDAYYSLFHPPNCPPAEASLLQWQRSEVRPGKRLHPQGHRHSSIPLWSKSEPTWPLPGDQWSTASSQFKVSSVHVCQHRWSSE